MSTRKTLVTKVLSCNKTIEFDEIKINICKRLVISDMPCLKINKCNIGGVFLKYLRKSSQHDHITTKNEE